MDAETPARGIVEKLEIRSTKQIRNPSSQTSKKVSLKHQVQFLIT